MAKSGITHIEFISKGFREILRSDGCRDAVQTVTDGVYNNAVGNNERGDTEETVTIANHGAGSRYIGLVSVPAIAETEDKALTRAIT